MTEKENAREILRKAKEQCWLSGFDFSILMQSLLVSENGYVMDTGNWENANAAIALMLAEKVARHPILWKLFMVA